MVSAEEIHWIQASRSGDTESFGRLVDRYSGVVTGVAYSVLGDFARSEDAGQEAFLEAWKSLATLSDPKKFAPWICTIARRRAIDLVRKQKPATSLETIEETQASSPELAPTSASEEEKMMVWQAVDGLPVKYREALVLFYRSEKSVRDVANSLGENEATIRQRLKRGRDLLRSEISETVERTLAGTSPSPAFALAVLGSIPGSLKTSAAAATAASSSTTGKALVAAAGAAKAGTLLGILGGLGGGLLGAGFSWCNAKYQSQRNLVVRASVIFLILTAVFLIALYCLVKGHLGIEPNTRAYAIALTVLIFGFQLPTFAWSIWLFFAWKKVTHRSDDQGDTILPLVAKMQASSQKAKNYNWTSKRRFLGLPLVDIQCWTKESIEEHGGIPKPAIGWIAGGNRAYGRLIGVGMVAVAPIAFGHLAFGAFAFGLISVGITSIGTVAMGGLTIGALAIGYLGFGGGALSCFAVGGMAVGYCALGGAAFATHAARGGIAWSLNFADGGAGGQAFGPITNGVEFDAFFSQHWFFQLSEPFLKDEFSNRLGIACWTFAAVFIVCQLLVQRWLRQQAQQVKTVESISESNS